MSHIKSLAWISVAAAVIYVTKEATAAATKVTNVISHDLNPVDSTNVINRGVSVLVRDNTNQKNLGSWIYCKVHPDALVCK